MARKTVVGVGRYYCDPATGQFLSVDPKVEQTQQAYLYAGDDPVNGSDPNGMFNVGAQNEWNMPDTRCRSDCGGGFAGLFSWVHHHWRGIVTVVGIALGAAAVVTGFGAIIGGDIVLGLVSGGLGAASGLADFPACIGTGGRHDGEACVGAIAGIASGALGAGGSFVELGSRALDSVSVVRAAVAGLLEAKGVATGAASVVWDLVNSLIRKHRLGHS